MKTVNRISILISSLVLPVMVIAHPGHDGDQTHGLAGIVILAATFVACRRVLIAVKSRRARNDR